MRKKTSGSIDGRPCPSASRRRQLADERQVEDSVDPAKEMILGDERLQVDARFNLRIECLTTPCMVASLLENDGAPNGTPPETRTDAKNQAESKPNKVPFFNRPDEFTTPLGVGESTTSGLR